MVGWKRWHSGRPSDDSFAAYYCFTIVTRIDRERKTFRDRILDKIYSIAKKSMETMDRKAMGLEEFGNGISRWTDRRRFLR